MSENGQNGNAPISKVEIRFDHSTALVSVECSQMSLSLAQMLCDEAVRFFEDRRRMMNISRLKEQMATEKLTLDLTGKGLRS